LSNYALSAARTHHALPPSTPSPLTTSAAPLTNSHSLHDALPIFRGSSMKISVLAAVPCANGSAESKVNSAAATNAQNRFMNRFRSEEHTSELQSHLKLV